MGGILRTKIVHQCRGCTNIADKEFCSRYANPAYWWNKKECPMLQKPPKKESHEEKRIRRIKSARVGQQKQRKKVRLSKKTLQTYARIGSR